MNFERTQVLNFPNAFYGMRNPKKSWNLSDSYETPSGEYVIGPNDMKLAQKLIVGGPEHRKFMRQIFVSVQITAPIYWWKEMDTYRIGVTRNSTSTMHTLANEEITIDLFEIDDFTDIEIEGGETKSIINYLEQLRKKFNETKDKKYWKELIRWLPESFLQSAMVTMSYENLYNIIHQRKGHKLSEWKSFLSWAEKLPYARELLFYTGKITIQEDIINNDILNSNIAKPKNSINKTIENALKNNCDCENGSCNKEKCTCKEHKETPSERDIRLSKEIESAIDEIIKILNKSDNEAEEIKREQSQDKRTGEIRTEHTSPSENRKRVTVLSPKETPDLFDFLFNNLFKF